MSYDRVDVGCPAGQVGNDLTADNTSVLVVIGANQGGKSTFLRSIGLAQLMTQSGMFVADLLHTNLTDGVFTHFKREEDAAWKAASSTRNRPQ